MNKNIKITKSWAMPNKNTFSIKPIRELLNRYIKPELLSIDAFANNSNIATITNDIDTLYHTDYNLDALDFYKLFDSNSVDIVLYDPPYSSRQVSEIYRKLDKTVDFETTSARYWRLQKDEISRILKPSGICISFDWNSNGIGKCRGFYTMEILLVAHGGKHNDTIVTVEKKINKNKIGGFL